MAGVPINDGNEVRAPRYLDLRQGKIVNGKSVPYDSETEILTAVPDSRKADGLPFYVRNSDKIDTWRLRYIGGEWTVEKASTGGGDGESTAFNPRGTWGEEAAYLKYDVVTHNGSSFFARRNNTGVIPAQGTTWQMLSEAGMPGIDGKSLAVQGEVPDYASLPPGLTADDKNKAWVNLADGLLYIWNGTAFPADGAGVVWKGTPGPTGKSLEIVGTVANYAALQDLADDLTAADFNKAWLNDDDGRMYIWNGAAFPGDGGGLPWRGGNGLSAYEIALANGFVGTEPEWLQSLQGATGMSAYDVAVVNGFVGTEAEWLESLKASSPISKGASANTLYASGLPGQNTQGDASNTSDIIIGVSAGSNAVNVKSSNYIGTNAGFEAGELTSANFIGPHAGYRAVGSDYSNLIGRKAGFSFTGNTIGKNNIIIGANISLPNGAADSINIGGVIFGTGAYNVTTGNPSIAPAPNGKIGIGKVNPAEKVDVDGKVKANSFIGSATELNGESKVVLNNQFGDYTLVLADAGKTIMINTGAANNLTIPLDADVPIPVNSQVNIFELGPGKTTIVKGAGITVISADNKMALRTKGSAATLTKIGTNTWFLVGDID